MSIIFLGDISGKPKGFMFSIEMSFSKSMHQNLEIGIFALEAITSSHFE